MKIFAANWKLHKSPNETREYFAQFQNSYQSRSGVRVVFFPSAVCLEACANSIGKNLEWGSQNCYFDGKGAFTGETSALVVYEMGARWALVGHSERRSLFGETDEFIAKKVRYIQQVGLQPMLCIGETLAEREAGKTIQVIKTQLEIGLSTATRDQSIAVAYEPVWAIGTGKVATASQVQEAHEVISRILASLKFHSDPPILYGGSVKAENAKELIRIPKVDGFLVGGASLEPKTFAEICACD